MCAVHCAVYTAIRCVAVTVAVATVTIACKPLRFFLPAAAQFCGSSVYVLHVCVRFVASAVLDACVCVFSRVVVVYAKKKYCKRELFLFSIENAMNCNSVCEIMNEWKSECRIYFVKEYGQTTTMFVYL